jgi:hypothetical protein
MWQRRPMVGSKMKCFNQERWNMLSRDLKVSVACRYCYLPYFSNLVVQTGLSESDVWHGICHGIDVGVIKENWKAVDGRWVKCFRYDDHNMNTFIDKVIKELS